MLFICSICLIIWITEAEPRAQERTSSHPTLTAFPESGDISCQEATLSWRKEGSRVPLPLAGEGETWVRERVEGTSVKRRGRGKKGNDGVSGASRIALRMNSSQARWELKEGEISENFPVMIRPGWLDAEPDGAPIGWDGLELTLPPLIKPLGSF